MISLAMDTVCKFKVGKIVDIYLLYMYLSAFDWSKDRLHGRYVLETVSIQQFWSRSNIEPGAIDRNSRSTYVVQLNLVIRNFLVTLKLFFNAKCSLSLWSKLANWAEEMVLNTILFLITKFDCVLRILVIQSNVIRNGVTEPFPLTNLSVYFIRIRSIWHLALFKEQF
jgi:hypothetical protein